MDERESSEDRTTRVTELLVAANDGDDGAREALVALLYDELRWLAHRHLLRQPARTGSFSTTELVHEAYLKLAAGGRLPPHGRRYFLGSASRAMRQVLVSDARRRLAAKRDPGGPRVPLELVPGTDPDADVLAVHAALEELAAVDERLVRTVECRFFGGLSVEETAEVLATSARTVKRDWRKARAWLHKELVPEADERPGSSA